MRSVDRILLAMHGPLSFSESVNSGIEALSNSEKTADAIMPAATPSPGSRPGVAEDSANSVLVREPRMFTQPELPPELWTHIFEHLAPEADFSVLESVRFACQLFATLVRPLLFRDLHVATAVYRGPGTCARRHAVGAARCVRTVQRLRFFAEEAVAGAVRTCRVAPVFDPTFQPDDAGCEAEDDYETQIIKAFFTVLPCFTKARHLRFEFISFGARELGLLARLPTLQHVTLCCCQSATATGRPLPVRHLSVVQPLYGDGSSPHDLAGTDLVLSMVSPDYTQSLVLLDDGLASFLPTFIAMGPYNTLQSLTLGVSHQDVLLDVLLARCPRLWELHVGPAPTRGLGACSTPIDTCMSPSLPVLSSRGACAGERSIQILSGPFDLAERLFASGHPITHLTPHEPRAPRAPFASWRTVLNWLECYPALFARLESFEVKIHRAPMTLLEGMSEVCVKLKALRMNVLCDNTCAFGRFSDINDLTTIFTVIRLPADLEYLSISMTNFFCLGERFRSLASEVEGQLARRHPHLHYFSITARDMQGRQMEWRVNPSRGGLHLSEAVEMRQWRAARVREDGT